MEDGKEHCATLVGGTWRVSTVTAAYKICFKPSYQQLKLISEKCNHCVSLLTKNIEQMTMLQSIYVSNNNAIKIML